MNKIPIYLERMKKLGYQYRGSEGLYYQFLKVNIKYKIHKFKENASIEIDK